MAGKPKLSKVHVIAVRWRFSAPLTRAEAREAVRDVLPAHESPELALWVRNSEVEECKLVARLAADAPARRLAQRVPSPTTQKAPARACPDRR